MALDSPNFLKLWQIFGKLHKLLKKAVKLKSLTHINKILQNYTFFHIIFEEIFFKILYLRENMTVRKLVVFRLYFSILMG